MVFRNDYLKIIIIIIVIIIIIIMSPSGNLYRYCTSLIWSCYIGQLRSKPFICAYSDAFKESVEFKQGLI